MAYESNNIWINDFIVVLIPLVFFQPSRYHFNGSIIDIKFDFNWIKCMSWIEKQEPFYN